MRTAIAIGLCASLSGACLYFADDKKVPLSEPPPPAKKVVRKESAATKPAPAVGPQIPVPEQKPKVVNNDVEGALERPTFADFSETPLSQVLMFLRTQHNIHIFLDDAGLANAMVDRDQAVTLQMKDVRLALILDLILEPLNLDYAVRENVVLFISSRERIAALRETSVMRIGDIIPEGAAGSESAERIVATITEQIDRDLWNANGGQSNIEFIPDARSLVVTTTCRTHRKIAKLLEELRSAKVANGMPTNGGTSRIAAR
jgi:hypothetical protein